jgi:NAD(P)H-flavin reductase
METETENKEQKGKGHEHVVTIHVNNKPVTIRGPKATGAQIKNAAIAQGVAIQANFQLLEELGGGRTRVIADGEEVHVSDKTRFVAIAPDDNS